MRLLTALILLLGSSAASAQEAGHRLFTASPGPWARKTTVAGGLRSARAAAVSGVLKQVLVPVSFADEPFTFPTGAVNGLYYGPGSAGVYSLPQFYDEASRGQFSVSGVTVAPVRLPRTRTEYTGTFDRSKYGGVGDNLDIFLKDVLAAVDSTVNFAPYADTQNGQPVIAALVILQPHQGGECTSAANRGLWAHRYVVSRLGGDTAGYATKSTVGGKKVYINDYILQSAETCYKPGALGGAGTVIHETGHLLGLPDLYSTNDSRSAPAGKWDLMSNGNYYTQESPAQMGAWSRWVLGWTNAHTLAIPAQGIARDTVSRSIFTGKITLVPFLASPEFLLLEDRRKEGADKAGLAGEGLLIWHINPAYADEAHMKANTVNNNPEVLGVSIYQGDGRDDLGSGANNGDSTDTWPGGAEALTTPRWSAATGAAQGYLSVAGTNRSVVQLSLRKGGEAGPAPYGIAQITPLTLPAIVGGETYSVELKLTGATDAPFDSVTWSASGDGIINASITGNGRSALLTGKGANSGQGAITIAAIIHGKNGDQLVQVTREAKIVKDPKLGMERITRALTGGSPLEADEVLFYDSLGNRNGRLDIGDVVLAIRKGKLLWKDGTFMPNTAGSRQ